MYSDQILAVVREVLCNAWDAHIAAGITDKPVEVTLTKEELTVKDYGHGIPHALIGEIYGTYGNSTKQNDGNQTGGFGLGCKAPFAYVDHFEVSSANAGLKTIYAISKSSGQAMGKPGITPITSFPSTETGLVVSLKLKDKYEEYGRFHKLIKRIASNGSMNIKFNDEAIEGLEFSKTEPSFLITTEYLCGTNHRVMVRYGNVIYPVESCDGIAVNYDLVIQHLDKIYKNIYGSYCIVLQAPPHSIAVTPSRESLSMQEHTIKTLNELMSSFMALVNAEFHPHCIEVSKAAAQSAIADKNMGRLLAITNTLANLGNYYKDRPQRILSTKEMADAYMGTKYPTELEFRKKDITFRLENMVTAGMLDRGLVQSYVKTLKHVTEGFNTDGYRYHYDNEKSDPWTHHTIFRPLIAKVSQNPDLELDRLYVMDKRRVLNVGGEKTKVMEDGLVPITQVGLVHQLAALPYLRKIMVVGVSTKEIQHRAFKHETFIEKGTISGYFFYRASRKIGAVDKAVAFFKKIGYDVVDLSQKYSWDPAPVVSITPSVPRQKGVPCLTGVLTGLNGINTEMTGVNSSNRIENPKALVLIKYNSDTPKHTIHDMPENVSLDIVQLFGAEIGVAFRSTVIETWRKKKGVKDFEDYVTERVLNEMLSNPRILAYLPYMKSKVQAQRAEAYPSVSAGVLDLVYSFPIFRKEFGLVNDLTAEDYKYIRIWNHINNKRHWWQSDVMKRGLALIEATGFAYANTLLLEKLDNNDLVDLINVSKVERIMKGSNQIKIDKVAEIVISAINNG